MAASSPAVRVPTRRSTSNSLAYARIMVGAVLPDNQDHRKLRAGSLVQSQSRPVHLPIVLENGRTRKPAPCLPKSRQEHRPFLPLAQSRPRRFAASPASMRRTRVASSHRGTRRCRICLPRNSTTGLATGPCRPLTAGLGRQASRSVYSRMSRATSFRHRSSGWTVQAVHAMTLRSGSRAGYGHCFLRSENWLPRRACTFRDRSFDTSCKTLAEWHHRKKFGSSPRDSAGFFVSRCTRHSCATLQPVRTTASAPLRVRVGSHHPPMPHGRQASRALRLARRQDRWPEAPMRRHRRRRRC